MNVPNPFQDGYAEHIQQKKDRRDRFAAAALTGLLANGEFQELYVAVAIYAKQYADALIAELDKP